MSRLIGKLIHDDAGATAIEYGLIAILLSTAAIAAWSLVGTNLGTSMNNIAGKL